MRLSALSFILCLAIAAPAAAQTRAPLTREGSSVVYERVLAKTAARLVAAPGAEGGDGATVRAFQPLYVYGRGEDGWLEVGRGVASGPEGWIGPDDAVAWKQNIVVSFSNPAGRERQVMFETEDGLMNVVSHEFAIGMARELRRKAVEGGPGAAEGVAALEPEEFVDIASHFYLLPILDWKMEEHPMTFEPMRVLELASLPLDEDEEAPGAVSSPSSAGIAFVIDTTRSMEPYITATQRAVADLIARIRDGEAGARTRFAAIGFRDSPEAAGASGRDIGYRTRVFLPLSADQSPEAVVAGFGEIEEADASTINFHEDSLSGVWEAINLPGWENGGPDGTPIRQRFVVLITDASPKPQGDPSLPAALRDLDMASVRERALEKGVVLMALHLRTPDGAANHRAAEAAYRTMSQLAGSGRSLYVPVELSGGGDPGAAFRPVVEQVANFVAEENQRSTEELRDRALDEELSPLEEASLAMRLAWLGRDRGARADPLLRFWSLDRALENPLLPALDVRLLVTKNELSTMSEVLRAIVEAGETTQAEMREGEFFELLQGALARIAQNPNMLVNTEFETLDEAAGDFLDDLPYQSDILQNITPEEWMNMGSDRRRWLDRVRSRVQLYEHFHDDPALWTALYEGAPAGEHVYAMPLEALP